jgi:hypothetical protein
MFFALVLYWIDCIPLKKPRSRMLKTGELGG